MAIAALFKKSFQQKKEVVTKADIARAYIKQPSITDYCPWRDYNEKHKLFLLEDNKSLAVCFDITPIASEAKPKIMMEEMAKSICEALKNAIPCVKGNPWTMQIYVYRRADLSTHYEYIVNNIPEERRNTPLAQAYLDIIESHFKFVSRKGGIFHDQLVTNQIFRGGITKVHAVLYRRFSENSPHNSRRSHVEDIARVARKFSDQLRSCGLKVKRLNGESFYQWMIRWFNPHPRQTNGDVNALLKQIQFPKPENRPFGWDLTENIFFNSPETYEEGWLFDKQPHKVMTIQSLTTDPVIGHLTAERKRNTDDKLFTLLDNLPEDSIFTLAITFQAPSEVELHLKTIEGSAVGRHALAMKVKSEVDLAFEAIADGDYLFPVSMALYLKGENLDDLYEKEAHAEALLNGNGFKVITDDELYPADAYMRFLPMCYDYHYDKHNMHRSRYIQLSEIAKLLPFYGRSRGTENPGLIAFNRGGEPWFYDPYKDKTKNSHFLLLGETGTGKSNLLNFILLHKLAVYNSRLFIVEAGGSFDLFADFCINLGLKVNKVKIDLKNPISLNPFSQGLKILDQIATLDREAKARFMESEAEKLAKEQEINSNNEQPENDDEENRDILGEMVIAALIMITGGEKKEEERIRRSDRMLIMDAIIDAAQYVKDHGGKQMIASDIVEAFGRIVNTLDPLRDAEKVKRAREMADSLNYFTKDPVSSRFFNTPGEPWELADVTVVDMGKFAQEGYEAQRAVAYMGCASKVLELAELNQYGNRAMEFVNDENHIFLSIPLLAAIQTRITKMGRKLGLWFGAATQNLRDFADESRKMLAMIEIWICLALPPDEIDQIERFKVITPEQRELFLSAKKLKGKYTEGVLLSPKTQGLFRNVPPRKILMLAATEQDEKYQRRILMEKLNLTELEVVDYLANQMMQKPVEECLDD